MIKNIFIKFKKADRKIKYLFVGVLNTVVGVGTEILVYILFGVPFSFGSNQQTAVYIILIASIISQIVGVTHSYFWNKYFTFDTKKKSLWEFIRFILVYAFSFTLSLLLKFLLNKTFGINIYIVSLITTFLTIIISYIGHNYFSFKTKE